jgi:hypothetical protein
MPKKNDPFAVLMNVAQDQQGYFTMKQAIRLATRTIRTRTTFAPGIGSESVGAFIG